MNDRPEWIRCVRTGNEEETKRTWCGREAPLSEFAFFDPTHAALNGRAEGRLVACHECVEAITKALRNGHSGG